MKNAPLKPNFRTLVYHNMWEQLEMDGVLAAAGRRGSWPKSWWRSAVSRRGIRGWRVLCDRVHGVWSAKNTGPRRRWRRSWTGATSCGRTGKTSPPRRYGGFTIYSLLTRAEAAFADMKGPLGERPGLPTGVGKTFLACALANAA